MFTCFRCREKFEFKNTFKCKPCNHRYCEKCKREFHSHADDFWLANIHNNAGLSF